MEFTLFMLAIMIFVAKETITTFKRHAADSTSMVLSCPYAAVTMCTVF